MKIFVIVFLGLLACSNARFVDKNGVPTRVVNGEIVNPGERPFQVSLKVTETGRHFCGGSIVSENFVVTAAHCVVGKPSSSVSVIVGTVSLKKPLNSHKSVDIIVNEKYIPGDYTRNQSSRNDIALIKVATPFKFSELVQPVALPEPHVRVKINSSAVLSGWGRLENKWSEIPDRLHKATIFIADPAYCAEVMREQNLDIYPTHVCAYDPSIRRGQCNADSGGPLTVEGVLTGIVSWSIKDPDCASTKYPGVYTRVSDFVDWIAENTK